MNPEKIDWKNIEFVNAPNPKLGEQFRPKAEENAALIQRLRSILPVVNSVPTYKPQNFLEQFVIYSSGGNFRLYVYTIDVDTGTGAWKYVALT
jgi:hypothetical protein